MSVKTIFKVLLGTMTAMVIITVAVEIFNINIASVQLRQLQKISMKQSCVLFTQETYKDMGNNGGAVSASDVLAADGTVYASGKFYNGNTAKEIWENLYPKGSTGLMWFLDNLYSYEAAPGGAIIKYKSAYLLNRAIQNDTDIPEVFWYSSNAELQANIDASRAKAMYDNMYTPINIGIPYMGGEEAPGVPDSSQARYTVERMFRWNLAQLISNCDSDNIRKDSSGEYYVYYKGFKCYTNKAKIKGIKYTTYDTSDSADRLALLNNTNIDASQLAYNASNMDSSEEVELTGGKVVDNRLITVVELEYAMPVAYEGVTPIKNVVEWAWSNKVDGTGTKSAGGTTYSFDDTQQRELNSSDLDTPGNTIPTTGNLVFTLVK